MFYIHSTLSILNVTTRLYQAAINNIG